MSPSRVPGVVGLACAFYDTPPLKALDLESVPPSLDNGGSKLPWSRRDGCFFKALCLRLGMKKAGSPQRLATAQQAAQADVIRQRSAGLFPRTASLFFLSCFCDRCNPRARAAQAESILWKSRVFLWKSRVFLLRCGCRRIQILCVQLLIQNYPVRSQKWLTNTTTKHQQVSNW